MAEINILIADDEESVHKGIRDTLNSIKLEYKILEDFYNTDDLLDFLDSEGADLADVLLLDHSFGGAGTDGMDVVPEIREMRPNLPILMLTAYDVETIFPDGSNKYNVDYVQKPVKASDLRFRITNIIRQMQEWESFGKKLSENSEFIEYLMGENDKLGLELDDAKNLISQKDAEATEKQLPMEMQELIQNVFPDVEFSPKSFRLLVKSTVKKADWNRMFRSLKLIDWKDENNAVAGIKVQKYKAGERFGYNDLWEYRFSKEGRIFAERRKGEKPLIVLIDPTHSYSDMGAF